MGLIVRSSSIHAAGCYTTTPIAKGTRVVEYTGPLLDKEEADRRYEDKPITYLFGIGDGSRVIDGHGIAMFINHSCDANCETEEIDEHVWIMAIRNIAAGEELCYDYCIYDGRDEDAPCNCGARKCRGSMYSAEELRRRKRLAQKQTQNRASRKTKPVKPADVRPEAKKKQVQSGPLLTKQSRPAKTNGKKAIPTLLNARRRNSVGKSKNAKKAGKPR